MSDVEKRLEDLTAKADEIMAKIERNLAYPDLVRAQLEYLEIVLKHIQFLHLHLRANRSGSMYPFNQAVPVMTPQPWEQVPPITSPINDPWVGKVKFDDDGTEDGYQ